MDNLYPLWPIKIPLEEPNLVKFKDAECVSSDDIHFVSSDILYGGSFSMSCNADGLNLRYEIDLSSLSTRIILLIEKLKGSI